MNERQIKKMRLKNNQHQKEIILNFLRLAKKQKLKYRLDLALTIIFKKGLKIDSKKIDKKTQDKLDNAKKAYLKKTKGK